jgi:GNAT superfamily N-acetyltransferase
MAEVEIIKGCLEGSSDRVVKLHGTYYGEHWSFGQYFESKVASELADFLDRYDDSRDGFWVALKDGRVEGAIAIDGIHADDEGAHLRWFIVSDQLRGSGTGSRLIDAAMSFCRAAGYPVVYLWTFAGLDAARHLYEREGFELVEQRPGTQWGIEVEEQRFECRTGDDPDRLVEPGESSRRARP